MAPLLADRLKGDLRPAGAARRTALLRERNEPLPGARPGGRVGVEGKRGLFNVKQAVAITGPGRRWSRHAGGLGRLACPPAPAPASGCGWWWPRSARPSCAVT